jgi:hypothetical protein
MKAILTALGTAVVMLALPGCGSEAPSTHQAPPLVRGDFSIVFHHDSGFDKRQFVTEEGRYSALTLDELGQATFYRVSGETSGEFTISGVPQGPFYLKAVDGAQYFMEGVERNFLLGRNVVGWPDAVDAQSASTALVLDGVDGLDPWPAGGALGLFCSNAGASGIFSTPDITLGATSLSGVSLPYTSLAWPKLIEAPRGDSAAILQYVPQTDGDVTFMSLRKVFRPGPFSMSNGDATSLAGSFEDAAQGEPLLISWRGSAFDALASDVYPNAESVGGTIQAKVNPLSGAIVPAEPALARLFWAPDMTAEDRDFNVTFGNPFPSGWSVLGEYRFSYKVDVDMPSGTKWVYQANNRSYAPLEDFFEGSIEPRLSPVRDIQINGVNATGMVGSVGETPTVSFSPPAKGKAGYFSIEIYEPDASNALKAVVFTSKMSVVIPPGVIEPGGEYFLVITAIDDAFSGPSKPFLLGNRRVEAEAVSGAFTL